MAEQTTVPLPEPVGWRCTQRVPDDKSRFDCVTNNPGYVRVYSGHNWEQLFTAAQLLAYGDRRAAEAVERCIAAAEAERLDQPELAEDIAYEQAITDVISAIRKGA